MTKSDDIADLHKRIGRSYQQSNSIIGIKVLHQVQKHSCTPQKAFTPKRFQLISPMKHSPASLSSNENTASMRLEDDDTTILNDFKTAIQNLKKLNLAADFLSFIQMVKENNFPLDNLSLLLFLETVRFMSKRITSEMWYRKKNKEVLENLLQTFEEANTVYMENLKEEDLANMQFEDKVSHVVNFLSQKFCNEANKSVWKNLDGIENVTSQPGLRLDKCGFNNEYTGELISVTQVKLREEEFESNEPPKKKYRRHARRSGGSDADAYSSAENSDVIDLDLQDYVLGQHAGQLLLDLNREYINKEDKYYEDDRKINMPAGMIVNGIYVYITVLDMTWRHYQKLRNNKTLDENDRATIYYTHARNILMERSRRVLIGEFLRLNNMELT
ncbi:unnamed protein product [Mytilus edulis]|uniref:Uncharacterized protein n=1 Tax=Mytilus edulis TaxID=6550 RepID=A0A8S3R4T0_MYTED|nr:unnamed protein product [Mytilus edulis]